jgi:hypothetical protein
MTRPYDPEQAGSSPESSQDQKNLKAGLSQDLPRAADLTSLELQTLARKILKLLQEDLRSENDSQGRSLNW